MDKVLAHYACTFENSDLHSKSSAHLPKSRYTAGDIQLQPNIVHTLCTPNQAQRCLVRMLTLCADVEKDNM